MVLIYLRATLWVVLDFIPRTNQILSWTAARCDSLSLLWAKSHAADWVSVLSRWSEVGYQICPFVTSPLLSLEIWWLTLLWGCKAHIVVHQHSQSLARQCLFASACDNWSRLGRGSDQPRGQLQLHKHPSSTQLTLLNTTHNSILYLLWSSRSKLQSFVFFSNFQSLPETQPTCNYLHKPDNCLHSIDNPFFTLQAKQVSQAIKLSPVKHQEATALLTSFTPSQSLASALIFPNSSPLNCARS